MALRIPLVSRLAGHPMDDRAATMAAGDKPDNIAPKIQK